MKYLAALTLGLAFGGASLLASPTTYTSQSAFDAAVGSTSLIDFEAQNPGGPSGVNFIGSSLTLGNVTFGDNQSRLFVFGPSFYGTNTSSYLNNNGFGTNLSISFANPVFGFGADFGELFQFAGNPTITLNLSTGDSFNLSLPYLAGTGNPMSFWGVSSSTAISSISIADPNQTLMIDNVETTTTSHGVPDGGSTVSLLGLALLGLAAFNRRARRA